MKYVIKNGAVSIDGKSVLECINLEINDHDKIAIVGKNGAGKTTLLNAIVDNNLLEEGIGDDKFQIIKQGNPSIGYLKQIELNDNNTLIEEVRKPFANLIKIEEKLNNLLLKMQSGSDSKATMEYSVLEEQFKLNDGYNYKKEYEVLLKKFGFTEEDKNKLLKDFSGGQKTKIAFVKMLLDKPDILLLDEPTNHLDVDTVEWLEEYLRNYKKAIILVSHDRMFINNIVDIVYDISYGATTKYIGNYDYYEKQKQLNYEKALKDYEYQQKEIKKLTSIYERFRSKPSKASMAMSRLHMLEKMDILERPNKIEAMTFRTNMDNIPNCGRDVLITNDLQVGYEQSLYTLNLFVRRKDKLGIIGPNGLGKSTILKTIAGKIPQLGGTFTWNSGVKIGYFDQNLAMLDENNSILEEFMVTYPTILEYEARTFLGSFLFKGDDVYKKLNVLSGGERVRLQLCKIFYSKPNVLLLDEPTNHLDIVGREYLEEILSVYGGTIIFVSHDRYFIKKVASSLLVLNKESASYYAGGYADYLNNIKASVSSIDVNSKENKNLTGNKEKKNNYTLSKELKALERNISKLELNIKKLEESLYLEEIYNNREKLVAVNNEISAKKEELESLNIKWLELSIELEN